MGEQIAKALRRSAVVKLDRGTIDIGELSAGEEASVDQLVLGQAFDPGQLQLGADAL